MRERHVVSTIGYSKNYSLLNIFESNGNLVTKYGDVLLCEAIDPRHPDKEVNLKLVDRLIEMGININYTNEYNSTPLMSAIFFKNIKIVNKLLDAGADVTIVTKYGERAYATAIKKGLIDIASRIKLLEPKELHDIEMQTEKFHKLGCPLEMTDFLKGEKLSLNFSLSITHLTLSTLILFYLSDRSLQVHLLNTLQKFYQLFVNISLYN